MKSLRLKKNRKRGLRFLLGRVRVIVIVLDVLRIQRIGLGLVLGLGFTLTLTLTIHLIYLIYFNHRVPEVVIIAGFDPVFLIYGGMGGARGLV